MMESKARMKGEQEMRMKRQEGGKREKTKVGRNEFREGEYQD